MCIRFALCFLSSGLELFGWHPHSGRQYTAEVLHVHVASHRHQRGVVCRAFPWVHLEGDDAARHAEPRIAEDTDASAERLSTTALAQLCVLFIVKRNNMGDASNCQKKCTCQTADPVVQSRSNNQSIKSNQINRSINQTTASWYHLVRDSQLTYFKSGRRDRKA